MDILLLPNVLSNFQENDHWENFSRYDNEEALHAVERKTSLRNRLLKEGVVLLHNTDKRRHYLWELYQRKMPLLTLIEDRPHHTDIPSR